MLQEARVMKLAAMDASRFENQKSIKGQGGLQRQIFSLRCVVKATNQKTAARMTGKNNIHFPGHALSPNHPTLRFLRIGFHTKKRTFSCITIRSMARIHCNRHHFRKVHRCDIFSASAHHVVHYKGNPPTVACTSAAVKDTAANCDDCLDFVQSEPGALAVTPCTPSYGRGSSESLLLRHAAHFDV